MREIKFRGMGINGDWHFGLLSHPQTKGVTASGYIGWCISNSVGCAYAYSVRPETIGQYTGLKDKNGKEIYEGDIIKGVVNEEVKWKSGIGDSEWGGYGYGWFFDDDHPNRSEVIGNIYENPELLK